MLRPQFAVWLSCHFTEELSLFICIFFFGPRTALRLSSVTEIHDYPHISREVSSEQQALDFVVDVGGTLGHYLLNYVHRGPVVTAHALKVTADHAVGSPQRKDDVAAVRAVVVAADAVPFRHAQSVEGHGGGLLPIWDAATVTVPPQHSQQNYDDHEQDHTARDNPHEESCLRAHICQKIEKENLRGKRHKGLKTTSLT